MVLLATRYTHLTWVWIVYAFSYTFKKRKLPKPMLYSYNLGSYWIRSLNRVNFNFYQAWFTMLSINTVHEHTNQDDYARKQILSYNLEKAVSVFDYDMNIYEEQTLLYLWLIAETSPQTLLNHH